MSQPVDERDFSEELFAHTRMSFWDHIEELRGHMWKAIFGFCFAMVISLFFGKPVLDFIAAPVQRELEKFYDRRVEKVMAELEKDPDMATNKPTQFMHLTFTKDQMAAIGAGKLEAAGAPMPFTAEEWEKEAKRRGVDATPVPSDVRIISETDLLKLWVRIENPQKMAGLLAAAQRVVGKRPTLASFSITEAFIVWFKVCMYIGVVLGSPWILYQMWSFVGAGLYPSEKKYVHKYLPLSLGLFLGGVALCQFLVIPTAVSYLLNFNEWIGMEPELRLSDWLHFALLFPLVFGLSFQTPLVMLVLFKLGIMDVEGYRKHRRMAFFLLAVLSMLLAAAPDAFSMLSMTIPLWILYELGIVLCLLSPRPVYEEEAEEGEAMVGV
ncbi:MAG: twin-arginine translocase subunit TatC [Planctomycetia bacterium]|nr:twin-arginine translocase subunit TatC [Planctomycetia bacterium]